MENIWRYYACPKCGYVYALNKKYCDDFMCKTCSVDLIDLKTTSPQMFNMPDADKAIWREETEEIVRAHPLFDESAFKARIAREEREERQEALRRSKPVPSITCPYCGHDKFQMVARKWSLLTGFFTNKVDRVCEKCKRRF